MALSIPSNNRSRAFPTLDLRGRRDGARWSSWRGLTCSFARFRQRCRSSGVLNGFPSKPKTVAMPARRERHWPGIHVQKMTVVGTS